MRFGKEVGPIGGLPPEQVVRAAGMVREGRVVSLAAVRFPGMPLFPGHPPFQVLNYRTPRGIRAPTAARRCGSRWSARCANIRNAPCCGRAGSS